MFKKPTFLFLSLLLLLSGCFEEAPSNLMGRVEQNWSSQKFESSGGHSDSMRSPRRSASNMVVDRSKLKGRRVAEKHNLDIEISEKQLHARMQSDFNRCLAMQCEVLNSNFNKRSARLSVRIIPQELPAFLKALEDGEGNIVSHNVSVDDRTMTYIDTAAKLKNKGALRARLQKLLDGEAARNVTELLKVERELSRVQGEIESITGQMRFLESQTSKARVNVSYSVPVYARVMDLSNLRSSFFNAMAGFVDSFAEVVEFIGEALPWIPVLLFGLWILIRTLKSAIMGAGGCLLRKKSVKKDS